MKFNNKGISIKNRAAAKKVFRREDAKRLARGVSPELIQRENSIFPSGYFEKHRILNFASAIGK